ncbi:ester cyclase [Sulfitobacter pseudonitzschiae]|nr:ester cyclase [Pseudosulfitobacter pseudonitzschiae]MBM2297748.1 ester cyclase [Pseudosulfitobacter pseudonitzschiae]MBM2302662.1 ester cyclase [Pseudosulfitobacter pseudonitzschiae]MBM2379306.1 ester cyclase [Pseudosulfitobacter pseudonitzschiae]
MMQIPFNFTERASAAFNNRDLDALLGLMSEDFHFADPMGETTGRAATRAREEALFTAFPDIRVEMSPVVWNARHLAMTAVFTGTFTGAFAMGGQLIPPSGAPFQFRFAGLFTFDDHHATSEEVFYDRVALMQALGQGAG